MPIHALIFDLDGTLADSLTEIADAMNGALLAHRLPTFATDAYRLMVGEGMRVLAKRAIGKADVPVESVLEVYQAKYHQNEHAKTWPYPGIDVLLEALARRKVPMAVLSNKPDRLTKSLVAQRFGTIPFVSVRGEQEGVPRKPDPAAAFELALALNVLPANIGFVGDTAIDMNTAKAAGMTGIGVLWGFRDRAELVGAGARHILSTPEELLPLLHTS